MLISAAWCGPDVPQQTGPDVTVFPVRPQSLSTVAADLVVADLRAFDTFYKMLDATRRLRQPVLFLVPANNAEALLRQLRDQDELCPSGASLEIILHRIRRMIQARYARSDGASGLLHVQVFRSAMSRAEATAGPDNPVSFLNLDIDHFKQVNDDFGYPAGDHVLDEMGVRLCRAVGTSAVVGRIGGEEFGLLCFGDVDVAKALAERCLAAVREAPFKGIEITVSIGIATSERRDLSLFDAADQAMYAAKARGRDQALHHRDLERRALRADRDFAIDSFEDQMRVVAERVGDIITRRGRRIFEELRSQADRDALTGLYGRRYFNRRLPVDLEVSSEDASPRCVALIDIDDFGQVNKAHGWPSGDRILLDVAKRILASVREKDWVARYGGEEIAVVMRASLADAKSVLERIRLAIASVPFATTQDTEVTVTISIGVAEWGSGAPQDLMEEVSVALLQAKASGKNCIRSVST